MSNSNFDEAVLKKNDNQIRKLIQDRNDTFFLEHNLFSTTVGDNKFSHFSRIWRSDALDDEDKKVIWNWIDAFVFLSDKYVNTKK